MRVEPSVVVGDKTVNSEQEVKRQTQAQAGAQAVAENHHASKGIVSRTWNSTISLLGFGRKDDSKGKDAAPPKEAPLVLNKHAI